MRRLDSVPAVLALLTQPDARIEGLGVGTLERVSSLLSARLVRPGHDDLAVTEACTERLLAGGWLVATEHSWRASVVRLTLTPSAPSTPIAA